MSTLTLHRAARVRSSTFDEKANTIEVIWSSGATVRRSDPWTGEDYDEALSMAAGAVRLDRLNAGGPVLDSHDSSDLGRIIGSVVKGSARIEDGRGLATVLLSKAAGASDTVTKIREGVITNVSVGYWIHNQIEEETDGFRTITATDWEPLEISAVAVPADAGAQFRSASTRRASGREAEIRRLAQRAGLPKFGERAIRDGVSVEAFFLKLAERLAGGTTMKAKTMSKLDEMAQGADAARALMFGGEIPVRSLDDFIRETEAKKAARPAEDAEQDGCDDDDDDLTVASADDDDDAAEDASDKLEDDRRRGARVANQLLGRSKDSHAALATEQRRHARAVTQKRVDEKLAAERGRIEARDLSRRTGAKMFKP